MARIIYPRAELGEGKYSTVCTVSIAMLGGRARRSPLHRRASLPVVLELSFAALFRVVERQGYMPRRDTLYSGFWTDLVSVLPSWRIFLLEIPRIWEISSTLEIFSVQKSLRPWELLRSSIENHLDLEIFTQCAAHLPRLTCIERCMNFSTEDYDSLLF